MIYFDRSQYPPAKDGGIYLKYTQIENLTETLIKDYKPDILINPQAVEYDDFLESYLGVDIDYQHIYSTSNQGDILGCALFSEQELAVFDKENMCKTIIKYNPITVVLDCSLVDGSRKIQENITGLHEGGHVWLHKSFFVAPEGQLRMNNLSVKQVSCRKMGVELFEQRRCSNAEMWREWQATTFAVTLALPKASLDITVPEIFRKYDIKDDVLVIDKNAYYSELSYRIIPKELSAIYNMSKEAIRYRLKKTGFYVTREEYNQANAQISLFDFI